MPRKPKKPRSGLVRDLWSGKYSLRVLRDRKKEERRRKCRERPADEQQ